MTTFWRELPRPDPLPISQTSRAKLRSVLLAELEAQAGQVVEHEATVRELTGQGDADSLLEREIAEAAAVRARGAIEEIRDAMARIDAGTYGICRSCGAPIPDGRLEIIPQARRCVACPAPIGRPPW